MNDHPNRSAANEDAEKAEVAERFRLFGEKGFRPEVFGIDDRVPGPMVTRRDCMLIASALSTVEPQAAPEGYALVPLTPTPEMIEVGCDNNPTQWTEGTNDGFAADVANDVYVSMVRAASQVSRPEHS